MRDQPQPAGDPYRELGLEPGASMAEVKRAYRRLAKAYHPDSAGEAALPRFLAIHEAYDRLVSGRPRAGGGSRTTRPAPPPTAEPWRADPERARAARERARRGRNATGTRPASGAGGGRTRTGTTGPSTGSTSASGSSAPGAREGRRRTARKATLGSTSYDEAREQTDATWSGASWYGPTSGEYWIVNPREYADPRKHGPTYQRRARTTGVIEDEEAAAPESPFGQGSAEPGAPRNGAPSSPPAPGAAASRGAPSPGSGASPGSRDAGGRRASGRRDWAAPRDEQIRAAATAAARQGRGLGVPGDAAPRDPVQSIASVGRELLGGSADDPIRRLGIALVAWPPIGLAAAAAIGDMTGCTTYSTDCAGPDSLLPWLAQAAILGLLLLLPPLARLFVGGTIAVLLALVPVTAFLLVLGGGSAPQAAFALAILLAAAWLSGVAWAARGTLRPARSPT